MLHDETANELAMSALEHFWFTGVLGVGEGYLLHRKTRRVESGDFAKIRQSSSEFP